MNLHLDHYYIFYISFLIKTEFSFCKNIVLLILDDLRPALGCYGDKNAYTPNIDFIAEGSIIFNHSYAQQALCAPSRNSFLTSRRPDTLRLYDFYSYWRTDVGNFTTLPQYFKENGYNTMSIGKVFHPGFHPRGKLILPTIRRKPVGLPDVAWNPWTDIRERDDIAELNISFPFGVIKDKQAKFIIQSYHASISYVDDLIGNIFRTLYQTKLDRNTIVGLMGDHGWSLGEHGEWSKYSNFDVATRVPLILKVPGLTDENREGRKYNYIQEPVELVDLFPTLVDMAGLKKIESCGRETKTKVLCTEGKSLLNKIMNVFNSNKIKEEQLELFSFSQYPRPSEYPTLKPNSDKPKCNEIKIMGYSLRSEQFRYTEWIGFHNFTILWNDLKATELYDHFFDPMENENIIDDYKYSKIKEELSTRLRKHILKTTRN